MRKKSRGESVQGRGRPASLSEAPLSQDAVLVPLHFKSERACAGAGASLPNLSPRSFL